MGLIGFVEVYNHPLSFREGWEGFVLVTDQDPATLDRVNKIRSNADYFEKVMGIVSEKWNYFELREFMEMTVVDFFTRHIRSYEKLKDNTDRLKQAHQWARQVMMNWLIHDGAIRVVETAQGMPHIQVNGIEVVRKSLGRLWREIHG